ncbi:hypothetical protein Tco_0767921, partial [Tanacetum coccineum]
SSGIRDRVRNKKGEGSSQARPSSKIKMQLPTPVSRTTRQKVMMLPAKMSKGKASALKNLEVSDDEKDPHGLPSTKELHDALACRIMVEQVTLQAWTNIMEGMSLEKLLDLHDNGYTLQVVVDNHLNDKVREMIKFYKETKKDLGVVTGREASLKAKYDGAVVGLDENPIVVGLREELKSLEGITCITVNGKNAYELKGKLLDDLHNNAFDGTNREEAVKHIEYFLRIVDPIDLPNFVNYKTMDIFTKGALRDYWKMGSDEIEPTNDASSDLEETDHDDEQEIGEIFRIETNLFNYETPLCKEFKEFNYLLKIDPDLFTKYIEGFKTYEEYKDDWIYEWNKDIPWIDEKP